MHAGRAWVGHGSLWGEWLVELFDLDLASGRILAGEVAYEGGLLIGWDVPAESVWVNQSQTPGTPLQVPLPE